MWSKQRTTVVETVAHKIDVNFTFYLFMFHLFSRQTNPIYLQKKGVKEILTNSAYKFRPTFFSGTPRRRYDNVTNVAFILDPFIAIALVLPETELIISKKVPQLKGFSHYCAVLYCFVTLALPFVGMSRSQMKFIITKLVPTCD